LEVLLEGVIALVDDDISALDMSTSALNAEGFTVRRYTDSLEALQGLVRLPADLAVLEMRMPRMDGMELLSRLRKDSSMPVIFLTSKVDEIDEMLGLRMGADDYLKKPVSQRLLIERVRMLLRRSKFVRDRVTDAYSTIERGFLRLDAARHQCTWRGRNVHLTVTEFLLLRSLVLRMGHVKNRHQLIADMYGDQIDGDDRLIDAHVRRLRSKFKAIDSGFVQIETLYRVGYRFNDASELCPVG
jgi:two-component system, OmpR family, response regulator ChvI